MPPTDQALEFVRDHLTSLRSDVGRLCDKLDSAVSTNQAIHADHDRRLAAIEASVAVHVAATPADKTPSLLERYGWVPKAAWPVVVILIVLLRDATPETRQHVQSIAAQAAGLPDVRSGASVRPEHASTTWVSRAAGGPR